MIRGFFRLLTLAALAVVFTAIYVVYDGLNDSGDKADCAVVLGAAVRADGQPSAVLRQRLDRAIEVYRAGRVPVIIVSGADQVEGEGFSESGAMGQYLNAHGVSGLAVIEDHHGINTDATARDVAELMRLHGFRSVMIVTSYYHITRTKMALKREGIHAIAQVHAGVVNKDDAFNIAREVADIYYHLFKYYLGPAAQKAAVEAAAAAQQLGSQLSSETHKVEQTGEKTVQP
jgi:vancomycin permeability regulator SanA